MLINYLNCIIYTDNITLHPIDSYNDICQFKNSPSINMFVSN